MNFVCILKSNHSVRKSWKETKHNSINTGVKNTTLTGYKKAGKYTAFLSTIIK
jgi:hypothetical protein